ncbi:MAG: glycosyltransferase family 4 protein [Novosphingobium sp.]|uniref:glycosyltransferase family 4 protein n=1 Tax=Novosphingobium sp. TaxID=1874826 RepID=UPI002735AF59|nr:glycosyltransferase family 4 protein [Novosphingobium sp.]MDP3549941.1 glycosyltransferase family 4 protein [Novosphingobium sp.]
MKIAVIVTEFPKSTETFIYRDLMKFIELGHEVRLYHVAAWRHSQTLHGFAEPLRERVRSIPLLGRESLVACASGVARRPLAMAAIVWRILTAYAPLPRIAAKSLALVPKALAIAADAKEWGAEHVHAEFAGHPATAAWIGRRMGGLPYSVSCRAHDIFRTQRLLDAKLSEAGGIRTVSEFGAAFLHRTVPAIAERSIQVIHSSVDTARIDPVDAAPPTDPFRILYVGALEPKKGVEYLLDALSAVGEPLGNWQLDLIGSGPSADALKAKAASLGDRVNFRGMQPFEVVAESYRTASVCVAPSVIGPSGRQEGIPNVMIEALAYQRPAITTAISGIPELIRDGETGLLVPQRDSAALGQALLRIFSDPAAALEMARRGRRHVEQEFDLTANASRQLAMMAAATT